MPTSRRSFLKNAAALGGVVALGTWPRQALAEAADEAPRLTILHTNDVHSHLDPFPANDPRLAGRGGIVNRARLLSELRKTEKNLLLFDAGDVFQGTPYFNFFHGEPELRAMSLLGYDAITMGNHDFDGGVDLFARQVKAHASFPVLVANYDLSDTPLNGLARPYKIFRRSGLKIGVFGLGIAPDGLIPLNLFGGTRYLDPVAKANEMAAFLRNEKGCSLVVCLSHLGFRMEGRQISDLTLAPQTRGIDLIIGGHTHTFLNQPHLSKNADDKPVLINQVGWGGVNVGRLDFTFDRASSQVFCQSQLLPVR